MAIGPTNHELHRPPIMPPQGLMGLSPETHYCSKWVSHYLYNRLAIAISCSHSKTSPELLSYKNVVGMPSMEGLPPTASLMKLLLNVTIQASLGPVQVVMTRESKVEDLVAAAVRAGEVSLPSRADLAPSPASEHRLICERGFEFDVEEM
uniref:DUF7054 domain-containing protein n=2 Tax=Fagus sylvatica TaxID=28930 RepID=A0A2N9IRG6_FAGSY